MAGMMRARWQSFLVGSLFVAATLGASPGYASEPVAPPVRVEPATRNLPHPRVTYVEPFDVLYWVELSTGAAWLLTDCRTEDDTRPCVWDAAHRGNRRGQSFVRLPHRVLPVTL